MKHRVRLLAAASLMAAAAITAASVRAADHFDTEITAGDPAADIADLYAWHTDDALVVIVTFGGNEDDPQFDDGVLYTVHLDRDGDNVSDVQIHARFGQDADDGWGVKVESLPGTDGDVIGPVDEVIDAGDGAMVFAGSREDPFFFDFEGYQETLETAEVSFDSTRDSFEGLNVTAIVLEMDLEAAADGNDNLQVWATTARKGE